MEGSLDSLPPESDVKNFHKCNLCSAIFTEYFLLEQHCELHDLEQSKNVYSTPVAKLSTPTITHNNISQLDVTRTLRENGDEDWEGNLKPLNSHRLQEATNLSESSNKMNELNSRPNLQQTSNTSENVAKLKISRTGGEMTCQVKVADGINAGADVRSVINPDKDDFSHRRKNKIGSVHDNSDNDDGDIVENGIKQRLTDTAHNSPNIDENIPGSNQRRFIGTGGLIELVGTSEPELMDNVSDYGESDTDLPINFNIEPKSKRDKCFTCDVCSKSFTLRSSLNRHSKLHVGDFICSVCGDLFSDNQSLKKHARIHVVKKRFKCRLCGEAFKLSSSLKKHILTCHKDETGKIQNVSASRDTQSKTMEESNADDTVLPLADNLDYNTDSAGQASQNKVKCNIDAAGQSSQNSFTCDFCSKTFSLRSSLLRHTKRHTLLATCFQCHVCYKTFTLKSSLQRHFMRKHSTPRSPNHSTDFDGSLSSVEDTSKSDQSLDIKNLVPIPALPKKEKPFKCYVCGNTFGHSSSLQRHLKTHTELGEGSDEKVIQCEICSETFSQFFNLQKHIMSHTGQKPFKCEYCEKSFFENGHLRQHIRIHTGERPYQCHVCSKAFSQGSSLRIHMKIHSSDIEDKQFICIVCSKSFSNFGNLQKHIVKHSGIRPYKCEICDKSFLEKNHLEKHRRIHTGEKNYVCHICSKAFTQYGNMKQHIKTHTGERTHICHVCSKGFTENSKLTEHMKIHTGERKFKCEICFKLFRQNNGLTRHMRKHTGEKPFHCDICYKQFGHSNSLKKHKQSHNRVEIIID